MKRKEKLDWLRANAQFDAVRPDLRTPILDLRDESFSEEEGAFSGFGPRPQSIAHGRGECCGRRKKAGLRRDTAFRFAVDKKEKERLGR